MSNNMEVEEKIKQFYTPVYRRLNEFWRRLSIQRGDEVDLINGDRWEINCGEKSNHHYN